MTFSSREGGGDFGLHVTLRVLKVSPADAGFVHQYNHQTDLFRQDFGTVDDCWIRSRLGKCDQLKGGNVASWKQAKQAKQVKQVKQTWKLGVSDAGVTHSTSYTLAALYVNSMEAAKGSSGRGKLTT